MAARPVLKNGAARRLFLANHLLGPVTGGPGKGADLGAVIRALGFVQLDSVNTLARAHDLILWSRRQQYRPPALDRLLRERAVFEDWTHDAAVIPIEYWPHWRHRWARNRTRLAERWAGWQRDGFLEKTGGILERIAATGPVTGAEVGEAESRGSGGWWDWHPSKAALEYLWRCGELSIAKREGFRKHYDLTERVIPEAARLATPSEEETTDWACTGALDRLGFATSGELAAFWALVPPAEAAAWCRDAAHRGAIEEVEVEGHDGRLRRAWARPGLLDRAAAAPEPAGRLRVLSPFDPALRDRARAERLFGFFYRIEIFVPEPKRRWGYYVFPLVEGARAVGRIDMKAERATGTLAVRALWPEAGTRWGTGRQARLMAELERVAGFAGLERIDFAAGWLREPGSDG